MKLVLRFIVFLLLLQGISSIWEFVDVATYGESQKSAMDALAAAFMANWLDSKIWEGADHG